jgi:saccharopine dehydrogenase (NADP+, L-glutamate forming)
MITRIHWLGAGLSSTPGIHRLAHSDTELTVWNLDREQTVAALRGAGVETDVREFELPVLSEAIQPGHIVVSMLPATMHLQIARLCLQRDAHFVSSSYVTDAMKALQEEAQSRSLCFVSECGLDPGIDHLFSHWIVNRYIECGPHPEDQLFFRSYCGGFPRHPNEFRYKFSWSPLGTLLALTSPARWIVDGEPLYAEKPWQAVRQVCVGLEDELFQAYPNRDSLPFLERYGFDANWHIEEFIRGTLRLDGWAEAWTEVFDEIGKIDQASAAQDLEPMAEKLGRKYVYDPGEPDRVVLSVELEAKRSDETTWFRSCLIDASGDDRGSAMARLVSLPVSLAAESVAAGEFQPGVHAATADPRMIERWLAALQDMGETIIKRRSPE